MEKSNTKVMVFGTFDGIHEGHRFFLREAKKLGNFLIAVVARDSHVETLKKHSPNFPLEKRLNDLEKENIADKVIGSDETLGTWKVILENQPNIVALGYDQNNLREALTDAKVNFPFIIEIKKIAPFKP